MNKRIASFLLAGMLVWATGCSEPKSPKEVSADGIRKEISADGIRKEVLMAVNKALGDRQSNTEHVAIQKDSCSLKIEWTGVSSKTVSIQCNNTVISNVSIHVDQTIIWYGTIYNVAYQNWQFDINTGCIDWTTPIWLQLNNCPAGQPTAGLSAQTQYWSNFL